MRKFLFAALAAIALVCPAAWGQNVAVQPIASNLPAYAHVIRSAITTATCSTDPDTGCAEIPAEADGSVGIEITGSWTATLQFEGTKDRSTYFAILAYPQAGGAPVTSTTANGSWLVAASGITRVRVRASAFTSGPVTVGMNAGPVPFSAVQFSGNAANLAAQDGRLASMAVPAGQWTVNSTPAVSTQATASKTAGAAGVRHVATSCSGTISPIAAQTNITLNLRDGATGAGAVLWNATAICAINTLCTVSSPVLNAVGSAATAMTCEWGAAPVATNFAVATLTGYDAAP